MAPIHDRMPALLDDDHGGFDIASEDQVDPERDSHRRIVRVIVWAGIGDLDES